MVTLPPVPAAPVPTPHPCPPRRWTPIRRPLIFRRRSRCAGGNHRRDRQGSSHACDSVLRFQLSLPTPATTVAENVAIVDRAAPIIAFGSTMRMRTLLTMGYRSLSRASSAARAASWIERLGHPRARWGRRASATGAGGGAMPAPVAARGRRRRRRGRRRRGQNLGTRLPTGRRCTSAAACASGFCADGVCCTSACTDACWSCNQEVTAGLCLLLPQGAPPKTPGACPATPLATCGYDGTCSGGGACRFHPSGTPCAPGSCSGRTAVVGQKVCNGRDLPGGRDDHLRAVHLRSGRRRVPNELRDGYRLRGQALVDGRCPINPRPARCLDNVQCASGFCVDSFCCDTACNGNCMSCDVPGREGTCWPRRISVRALTRAAAEARRQVEIPARAR